MWQELTAGRVNGEKTHTVSDAARTASLTHLRRWLGDGFFGQSCAHARIEWGNPVPTPGLTAGRVNGEKKHSASGPVRTDSLTDLRRWPGDGFFVQKAKLEFRDSCRTYVAWRGFNAGQVARPGGFYTI